MTRAKDMLDTYPGEVTLDAGVLADAVDALATCAQACTACADACLAEEDVAHQRRCIRLDLDCADVCTTTLRVLSRQTASDGAVVRAVLEACAEVCRVCAEECEQHASDGMDHCRVCAEACRRCEQACRDVLGAMT